ncbi:OmpA family protein [Erythrobacter aureus]|uniref:OmpA family protein n=1 Tax=Erythrobacter aureus TaxID=2182384 RepID=UPI001F19C9E0|nr:OmpA family protein [Erythrobacter aureus]
MRKFVIGMAMASTALASPALAKDDSWYIGAEFGAMLVEDTEFEINGGPDAHTINHDYGFDGGGYVGYDFGAFRLEAEVSYRQADVDSILVGTPGLPYGAGFVAPSGSYPAGGDVSALSFMLNGLLDFGPDDGLQGFVGGGVGVARTSYEVTPYSNFASSIDDSDSGLAWQVLAGVRAPLTDNVDVGLRYRYFNADSVELVDLGGNALEDSFTSHSLMGTLEYNFGAPPRRRLPRRPAAAASSAAASPPPPSAPVCETGPYIVFFNWDESAITPEAATILDNAVSAYANCGTASVMLAGHTDRSGSVTYNMGLAERRNDSVRGYLSSRGIPDGRITSEAFGESQPRVPTADGVRELQNRRVEITYGPGSGM